MSNYVIQPGSLAETIFKDKYAFPGEEEWKDCAKRVAKTVAMAEPLEEREVHERKFYDAINSGDFCPGGRILFGAGRLNNNMLNCYALTPNDNIDSIGKTISDMYKISCGGGGVGLNFSEIRPKGEDIQNIKYSAPGSISVMKMINEIGNHVMAGRSRRVALMSILNITHPDLLEFLNVKLDRKELTNFNISVAITDRFMEAVHKDEEWYFTFGGRHVRYYVFEINRISELGNDRIKVVAKTAEDALGVAKFHYVKHFKDTFEDPVQTVLKAKDLWHSILKNATECGEPGIYNLDFANSHTNVSYFETMQQTNPSLRWDTLVYSENGWFKIKDLAETTPYTKVVNYKGELVSCKVFKSGINKQLYKITFNDKSEVFCTPDHKWPIITRNINCKRDNKISIDCGDLRKKETSDLQIGDLIYHPVSPHFGNKKSTLTYEEGFVLGWNYGDGWSGIHKRNGPYYGFIFSQEDSENGIANIVADFVNSRKKNISRLRLNKGCYELYVNSKEFCDYFYSLGHRGKKNGLPECIWTASEDFILGYLDGLFSSDGHVCIRKTDSKNSGNYVNLTTCHEKLAFDVKKLLRCIGVSCQVRKSISLLNGKSFVRYDVNICEAQSKKLGTKLSLTHLRKHEALQTIVNQQLKTEKDYLRIVNVEATEIYEDVYDITVDDNTHTFLTEYGFTSNCGEIPLPAYSNCCLGNINLSNMVSDDGEIDWKKLARTVRIGVRFLDDVLTANHFPIPECKEAGIRSRRIGLGVMGFHYMLIKAGYRYGSEACLEFTERLFQTIRYEAYKASMNLARHKGSFEAYDWSKLRKEKYFKTLPARLRTEIRLNGLRNAVLLTVPPTGSTAMVLGVSTGIEPIFSPIYKRRWRTTVGSVWNEKIVVDPLFKYLYLKGKNVEHVVGAYDVTPEEHIKMQATIQQFIDSAVSKTCNLPETFTMTPEIQETLTTYAADIKGFTFYKAGSRGNEPLTRIDPATVDLDKLIIEGELVDVVDSVDTCKNGVCEL
jgi:ribonucleoside-diphosphate reductase alpha chain